MRKKYIDIKSDLYQFLAEANNRVAILSERNQQINSTIAKIHENMSNFAQDAALTRQKKKTLIVNLFTYLQSVTGFDDLKSAIKAMAEKQEAFEDWQPPAPNHVFVTETDPKATRIPVSMLESYAKIRQFLPTDVSKTQLDLTLLPRPKRFYSDFQEKLYDKFLIQYHPTVNQWALLMFFQGIPWEKIDIFRIFYTYLRQAFYLIYENTTIGGYTLALRPGEDTTLEEKVVYLSVEQDKLFYTIKYEASLSSGELNCSKLNEANPTLNPLDLALIQPYFYEIIQTLSKEGKLPALKVDFFQTSSGVYKKSLLTGHEQAGFVAKTEFKLIDQCLKLHLCQFYNQLGRHTEALELLKKELEILKVTLHADSFEVNVDKDFLDYATGGYAQMVATLQEENKELKQQALCQKECVEMMKKQCKQLQARLENSGVSSNKVSPRPSAAEAGFFNPEPPDAVAPSSHIRQEFI